jgi:hypothetical protein
LTLKIPLSWPTDIAEKAARPTQIFGLDRSTRIGRLTAAS